MRVSKVGLLVALVLAVSPFHVRFAQETRVYTLLMFNASLALCSLVRLLTDPRSNRVRPGQQSVDFWQARRVARGRGLLPRAMPIGQGQKGN